MNQQPTTEPGTATRRPSTIAIDGPAGSGKSTIGHRVAQRLGYLYFDTGVVYRAVTWLALQQGVPLDDEDRVAHLAATVDIDIRDPGAAQDGRLATVLGDGVDITWDIRGPEVDASVSRVAAYPRVRQALIEQQRRIGHGGRVVMVGRDIGTVIMPEADLKIFLDASVAERARRRYSEAHAAGQNTTYAAVLTAMQRRDAYDSTRATAPLRAAPDAITLDSTDLATEETLARVLDIIQAWRPLPVTHG
jgi:cytidylate kinase